MTYEWDPISSPFGDAPDNHNIIVIGSGYGGGVAASRLARTGQHVTLLERGSEIAPGDYPRTGKELASSIQVTQDANNDRTGDADALFDLRVGKDISVLVGCGLGGTSLINANVAIEPDRRIFDNWPAPYGDDHTLLDPYFDRARKMLGSNPYPADRTTPKLAALEHAADGMKARFARPDINVTFQTGPNAAGVMQAACTDCGDCVSGCNYSAKNTVLMNYLPDAKAWQADIYTGAHVSHILKAKTGWTVVVDTDDGPRKLYAKMVILAAGTLGSTEILLRSKQKGLALSEKLGDRFSGNGDVYAFGYNAKFKSRDGNSAPIFGVGAGPHDASAPDAIAAHKPGPCITGMIDLRDADRPVTDGILIEEGVMPGAFAAGYATAFPAMSALMGDPMRFGDTPQRLQDMVDHAQDIASDPNALSDTAYRGPLSRTMPYLVMSHDNADGSLTLEPDNMKVQITWPNAGLDPSIVNDASVVRDACDAIGAEYLPMPLWQDALGNRLITVHPLGGCTMGEDVDTGVVNSDCAVFDMAGGVHDGLFVCDGAVIPGAIGVNPHLTITAVAERAVAVAAAARGWTIDLANNPPKTPQMAKIEPKFDPIAELDRVIGTLQRIKQLIAEPGMSAHKVGLAINNLWKDVLKGYKAAIPPEDRQARPLPKAKRLAVRMVALRRSKTVVLPILNQALDALVPIRDAMRNRQVGDALTLFQSNFGDVSPAGFFDEIMTGHLSDFGPKTDNGIADPHAIAGHGPDNCTFDGRIRADSIQALLATPDTPGHILEGTLTSPVLGGTFDITKSAFHFLVPDTDKIDAWNMIYRGTLKARKGNRTLQFEGKKTLQRRAGSHWWRDLTLLSVDITDENGQIARGQISVSFENVVRQARNLTVAYDDEDLLNAFRDAYDTLKPLYRRNLKALPEALENRALRALIVKFAILCLNATKPESKVTKGIEDAYKALTLGKMGALVMRNYAGLYSYLANFPAKVAPLPTKDTLPLPIYYHPECAPGARIKLTRYYGGKKGPVILAGGFGTKASSFATPTVDQNIVEMLAEDGFDVWLFDYRGSGDLDSSLNPFTLDDVALKDWPTAISTVIKIAKPKNGKVQTLVHCIGSMTLFMAILAGEKRVQSVIASQLATHAISNWLNYAKADGHMAKAASNGLPRNMWGMLDALPLGPLINHIAKHGIDVLDPCSPSTHYKSPELDLAIDGLLWSTPAFGATPCNSPTCHRITAIFGPSYKHDQLNQATHDAIADMFGPVSTKPFEQIADIYRTGHVRGARDYMTYAHRLNMPIHLFSGANNQEMLPEATLRTFTWLNEQNPELADNYSHKVYQNFGHMDCFIGQDAHQVIFPRLLARLNKTA